MDKRFIDSFFAQLDVRNTDSDYIRLVNPFDTSSKRNMTASIKYNFVQDWKTGYKKNIAGFVADYLNIPYAEACVLVGPFESTIQLKSHISVSTNSIKLPHNNLLFEDTYLAEAARKYLTERGMDAYNLITKGWCVGTEDKWYGRIIIPFKIYGDMVYYIGRTILGHAPKYLNPKKEDVSVGKSELFYNQEALLKYDEGNLVEGVTDAEQLGDSTVASLGWKLSSTQVQLIRNSRWKKINIVVDKGFEYKGISNGLNFTDIMEVNLFSVPEGYKDVQDSRGKVVFFRKL